MISNVGVRFNIKKTIIVSFEIAITYMIIR